MEIVDISVKSLIDTIRDLPKGKVLDVSNLNQDRTGIVIRNRRKSKSKKYRSENLPIASYDLEHYILAIEMLPGGKDKYSKDIECFYGMLIGQPYLAKKTGKDFSLSLKEENNF